MATITSPATGSSHSSQALAPRSSVAISTPTWKTVPKSPLASPMRPARATHFRRVPAYRPADEMTFFRCSFKPIRPFQD